MAFILFGRQEGHPASNSKSPKADNEAGRGGEPHHHREKVVGARPRSGDFTPNTLPDWQSVLTMMGNGSDRVEMWNGGPACLLLVDVLIQLQIKTTCVCGQNFNRKPHPLRYTIILLIKPSHLMGNMVNVFSTCSTCWPNINIYHEAWPHDWSKMQIKSHEIDAHRKK